MWILQNTVEIRVSSITCFCLSPEAKTLKAFLWSICWWLAKFIILQFIITCLSTIVSSLTADNNVGATLIWQGENKLLPVVLTREKWRDVFHTWSGVVFLSSQLLIISCCPQEKQILSRFGRTHGGLNTHEVRDWLWANMCSVIATQLMRYLGKSI